MYRHFAENTSTHRLLYSAAAGIAASAAAAMAQWSWPVRGLTGWVACASVYLILAWWLAFEFDAQRTRRRAQAQDQPGAVLFLAMLLAVLASVAAIAAILQQTGTLSPRERPAHIALSLVALAVSWLVIHTIFAFRYAHRYYQEEVNDKINGGGLIFPGKLDPDYYDFMYYSYVVGMTSQVSDVQVTSRQMRRLTLVHGVLAFGFNMLLLALSINVVAGSMQ